MFATFARLPFLCVLAILVGLAEVSIANVDIPPGPVEIVVGPQWSDQARSEYYGPEVGAPDSTARKIRNTGIFDTPISGVAIIYEKYMSDFSSKAPTIASLCRKQNPNSVWNQISCAAKSIHIDITKNGFRDLSTECRARAEAFREVFNELKIPRSNVSQFSDDNKNFPHVVNRIILTDKTGRPLSYILDVGMSNDRVYIFPLTDITANFHKMFHRLPDVTFSEPSYQIRPVAPEATH